VLGTFLLTVETVAVVAAAFRVSRRLFDEHLVAIAAGVVMATGAVVVLLELLGVAGLLDRWAVFVAALADPVDDALLVVPRTSTTSPKKLPIKDPALDDQARVEHPW
jgi:hypothetical protein